MNRLGRVLFPLLSAVMLLGGVACSHTPDGVLTEKQLAELMVELQYAEALLNDGMRYRLSGDSTRMAVFNAVLERHGVTPQQYDSTLRWYGRNMVRYVDACELADSIIADSLRSIDRRIAIARQERVGGDTIDMWPYAPMITFSERMPSDIVTFAFNREISWQNGDVFIWEMQPINNRTPLTARLVVEYADPRATTEIIEAPMTTGHELLTITFQLDSTKTARRVTGFMWLPAEDGEEAYVNNIRLRRTGIDREDYYGGRRFVRQFYGAPRKRLTQ